LQLYCYREHDDFDWMKSKVNGKKGISVVIRSGIRYLDTFANDFSHRDEIIFPPLIESGQNRTK